MYLRKIYFELQYVCVCVCVVTRPCVCLVGMSCWPTDTEKMVQIIPGEAPSVRQGRMDGDMVQGGGRRRSAASSLASPGARLSPQPAKGPGLRE